MRGNQRGLPEEHSNAFPHAGGKRRNSVAGENFQEVADGSVGQSPGDVRQGDDADEAVAVGP